MTSFANLLLFVVRVAKSIWQNITNLFCFYFLEVYILLSAKPVYLLPAL